MSDRRKPLVRSREPPTGHLGVPEGGLVGRSNGKMGGFRLDQAHHLGTLAASGLKNGKCQLSEPPGPEWKVAR